MLCRCAFRPVLAWLTALHSRKSRYTRPKDNIILLGSSHTITLGESVSTDVWDLNDLLFAATKMASNKNNRAVTFASIVGPAVAVSACAAVYLIKLKKSKKSDKIATQNLDVVELRSITSLELLSQVCLMTVQSAPQAGHFSHAE